MVAIFIARNCREKGASMMSEGKTIGQLMEEMRAKAGAQNYHGHGYMDLQRFAEDTRHMIMLGVLYLYLTKISTALDMDYSLYKYWVVGLSHSLQIKAFGEDLIPICLTLLAYLFLPTAISLSLFLRLDLRDLERR